MDRHPCALYELPQAIERAQGKERAKNAEGRPVPLDAIDKATRAATKPDGTLNMLTWERIYQRERRRELSKPTDSIVFDGLERYADNPATYVAHYITRRNLKRD